MAPEVFPALVLDQVAGETRARLAQLSREDLPPGDALVRVAYSSLNYKDALAVTGRGRIVRSFPMVPGVDLAGTVEAPESPEYVRGNRVVLTGWGVGERYWGGYAGMARVKAEWLTPLPEGLDLRTAMGIGTAGLAAMLGVMALEAHGCRPDGGPVLVTGASGGAGSIAVAVLSSLGYHVVASTGRPALHEYLLSLGAREVLDRSELAGPPERPLASGRWAGAVDTVGGDTLATLLTMMAYGSSVASIGLAGGHELHTTVYPFILRGVKLLGIDSVMLPRERRPGVWARLARDLPRGTLERILHEASLAEVPALCERMLTGQVWGRVVIRVEG